MIQAELELATIDDLLRFNERAELINGRIVPMTAVGHVPNRVVGRIFVSLRTQLGQPYSDGMGFDVGTLHSGRQSFCPDVSFYLGPPPKKVMRFIEGPPTFAVEVRSEGDYGRSVEIEIAAKRADYFEAGTLVVWDVDTEGRSINCYRKSTSYVKEIFSAGAIADAEPAVPGWRIEVDDIFRD